MSDRAVTAEIDGSRGAMDAATGGTGAEVPYRGEMERAFGEDFGGVQAHLGQQGPLGEMNAVSAARGDDVAFASSQPDRGEVAHELAHVVQQRRGGAEEVARLGLEPEDSPAEREADAAANAFAEPARAGGEVTVAVNAARVGSVARAIPSNKPKKPPTATAPEWLGFYFTDLASSIRFHLGGARIPPGHPRLTWSITPGEVAAQVWDRLAPKDFLSGASLVWEFERLVAPGLWKRIDEVRPIDPPDPQKPGDPQGRFEPCYEVSLVLARDLEKVIASATARLGPRIVSAIDTLAHDDLACEPDDARDASIVPFSAVVRSHPIDQHVLEILGIPGTALIESAPAEGADPFMDHGRDPVDDSALAPGR